MSSVTSQRSRHLDAAVLVVAWLVLYAGSLWTWLRPAPVEWPSIESSLATIFAITSALAFPLVASSPTGRAGLRDAVGFGIAWAAFWFGVGWALFLWSGSYIQAAVLPAYGLLNGLLSGTAFGVLRFVTQGRATTTLGRGTGYGLAAALPVCAALVLASAVRNGLMALDFRSDARFYTVTALLPGVISGAATSALVRLARRKEVPNV
jgi:hypothetical protein